MTLVTYFEIIIRKFAVKEYLLVPENIDNWIFQSRYLKSYDKFQLTDLFRVSKDVQDKKDGHLSLSVCLSIYILVLFARS